MDGRQLNPRARLAIAVAAALAIAATAGALLAGDGGDDAATATAGAGVALSSADAAVAAQGLTSALAAYAVQAQMIETVADAAAHGVQLRRYEQALARVAQDAGRLVAKERGRAQSAAAERAGVVRQAAERLLSSAVAARERARSEQGVAALRAFGREAQKTSARLQSLLAVLAGAQSAAAYDRALAEITNEIARRQPNAGSLPAGADDPVPAG